MRGYSGRTGYQSAHVMAMYAMCEVIIEMLNAFNAVSEDPARVKQQQATTSSKKTVTSNISIVLDDSFLLEQDSLIGQPSTLVYPRYPTHLAL